MSSAPSTPARPRRPWSKASPSRPTARTCASRNAPPSPRPTRACIQIQPWDKSLLKEAIEKGHPAGQPRLQSHRGRCAHPHSLSRRHEPRASPGICQDGKQARRGRPACTHPQRPPRIASKPSRKPLCAEDDMETQRKGSADPHRQIHQGHQRPPRPQGGRSCWPFEAAALKRKA